MEEEQTEIDETRGGGFAVDADMPFEEMPSAGPDEQGGELGVQPVFLAPWAQVRDGASHGRAEVQLPIHAIPPGGRVRVLEIRHEHLRARVERVDHHLSIGRPGDLNPAIGQIRRNRSDAPRVVPNPPGLRTEAERLSAIHPRLALHSTAQQVQAGGIESSLQLGDEFKRFRREDLSARALWGWANLRAFLCRNHPFARDLKMVSLRGHDLRATPDPSSPAASSQERE